MINKVVKHLCNEIKRLSPSLTSCDFLKLQTSRLQAWEESTPDAPNGIVDNKENYAYIRLTAPAVYSAASNTITSSCSNFSYNIRVNLNLRLVFVVWYKDPFAIGDYIISLLSRINLNIPNETHIKGLKITPERLNPFKEEVTFEENPKGDIKLNKNLNCVYLDFEASYNWHDKVRLVEEDCIYNDICDLEDLIC